MSFTEQKERMEVSVNPWSKLGAGNASNRRGFKPYFSFGKVWKFGLLGSVFLDFENGDENPEIRRIDASFQSPIFTVKSIGKMTFF